MKYFKPEMMIIVFEAEDVITTSGSLVEKPDPDEGFDFADN